MSDAVSTVSSLVSGLNSSIDAAVKRLQAQQTTTAANIKEYQKTVNKSSSNLAMFATDIGILAKGTTRLNVVSNLASKDSVDFYKFRLTSKSEVGMGQVSDPGLRVQVQTKLGVVVADSDKTAGENYDAFKKLAAGELTLDRGDYTVRVSRVSGDNGKGDKNYALQLTTGSYTQDYDTVAKQPKAGDSPWQLSTAQQASIDAISSGMSNLSSISYGQTGTQKLMGSFSLFA